MRFHFSTISSRLIFYVTLSVLTLFAVICGLLMVFQYALAMLFFLLATSWHVDSKASEVEKRLVEVQTTILANDVKVMNNLNSEEKLANCFQDILYNQSIYGCAIALKPDTVNNVRCELYAHRDKNGGVVVNRRPNGYKYEERDFFKETQNRMAAYWSDPYLDDTIRVATFSRPLLDKEGNFLGVLCADVLLDSIAQYVATEPSTSNSTVLDAMIKNLCSGATYFIISRNGYFVLPPDETVSYNDTYETYALRHQSPEFKRLGEIMVKRLGVSELFPTLNIDGEEIVMSYSYITKVGWTVVVMYPTEYIKGVLLGFCLVIMVFFAVGMLLLVSIIWVIVRRMTRPLLKFVDATKSIADGNFDVELPGIVRYDEVKMLRDSIDEMRLSLKDYMAKLKETTADNERMEQELNIASHIQMSMLPESFPNPPETPEVSIFAYLKPAREIGGDLYDFFIRGGHLHFIIADVSGKGMPAAMIMAVTSSMFRALQRRDVTPEKTVKALNNMLLERNSAEMFVTMIVGDLNLSTGELSLCNAGHTAPYIVMGGERHYMDLKKNIPAGIFLNYSYKSDSFILSKDARLLLYTDGVTEATNSEDALYEEDRLAEIIKQHENEDNETLIGSIVNDISEFTGDTPQSDDLTMMVLQYHGSDNIISIEIPFSNEMSEVTRATTLIEEVCEKLSVDFAVCASIQLALEEAMVNVISYAYENGRANIDNHFKITSDGKVITFILTDNGMPFDPTKAEMPDTTLGIEERRVGGLGIMLVNKIMDTVNYQRKDGRNILIMTKLIETKTNE